MLLTPKDNDMKTDTLTITFDIDLTLQQVRQFRGAVLTALPAGKSVIFHNHEGEGLRYHYPMVQYKDIGGKAAILFINQGIEESSTLISICNRNILLGQQPARLTVSSIKPDSTDVRLTDEVHRYKIENWLPVNVKNYSTHQKCRTEDKLYDFLSCRLTADILMFAKGIGHMFTDRVQCEVACIVRKHMENFKDVLMIAYDAEFITNVALPDHIGLGKHASRGAGKITKINI